MDSAPRSAWPEFVDRNPVPLLTQTTRWLDCLLAMGHRDTSRLYELPGGRRLLLPLVSRGSGALTVAASWPTGLGYGGVLASDGQVTPEDAALVAADVSEQHGLRLSIAPSPWRSPWTSRPLGARAETTYLTQVLPLSAGYGKIWSGYSANVRRSVRRAERSHLELSRTTCGAGLETFEGLYRMSVDRWARAGAKPIALARANARLTEPSRHLETIARVLAQDFVTWTASLDGEAVASTIVLHGGDHAFYWRGAMNRELAARTHANALLHHLAIQESVAAGHHTYSFGESDEGSALADYKAKFGAVPLRWSAYHFERLPVTAAVALARRVATRAGGSAHKLAAGILALPSVDPRRKRSDASPS